MKKKLLWIIPLALLILIQLFPVNRPANAEDNPADLLLSAAVPESVASMLKTSCYDCHSDQTEYPFYASIAPVSWLVVRDVRVGREQANFSGWDSLSNMQKAKLISGIIDEVEEGKMPMPIYTMMHPKAKLDENERDAIVDWAAEMGERLFE